MEPTSIQKCWKAVNDFSLYEVSNYGEVRNVKTGKLLKQQFRERDGFYHGVRLSKKGKISFFLVHRLVAIHFIDNPDNKPQVNHLGTKDQNEAWNLEWTTREENCKHAFKNITKQYLKPVIRTDPETGEQVNYKSLTEAATQTGYPKMSISQVCHNGKPYKGYQWQYTIVQEKCVDLLGEKWTHLFDSTYEEVNTFNYLVSNMGRVKTPKGNLRKIRKTGLVSLSRKKTNIYILIHRLVLMAWNVPNPEAKPEVDHIDSDWRNNQLDNLRWATTKENYANPNTPRKKIGVRVTNTLTDEVTVYDTIQDAVAAGYTEIGIHRVCSGKQVWHKRCTFEKIYPEVGSKRNT